MKATTRAVIGTASTYIVAGLFSTLTSVLASYFMGDVNMAPALLGIFFSLGGVMTAIIASLPGRVVDKVGAKKVLIAIIVGEMLSLILFPLSQNVPMLFIAMSLNCFVTSFSTPCNTQLMRALDVKDPAKLLRFNSVGSSLAGMFASFLAARLIDDYGMGWRTAVFVFVAIGAVVAVIGAISILSLKLDVEGISVAKKVDTDAQPTAKNYRYTPAEARSCLALSLIYIGYMGVGITISVWLPTLLAQKGFSGTDASLPTTVGTAVQLLSFLLMPTLIAKILKTTKYTPVVCGLLAVVVLGTMLTDSLIIICISRGLLAVCMSFLSLHVQSDMALTAPKEAAGRYSSTALASANAGGVLAVILTGWLSPNGVIILLVGFAILGVIGAVMYIKPAQEIIASRGTQNV